MNNDIISGYSHTDFINFDTPLNIEGMDKKELLKSLRDASEKPMFLSEEVFCNIFKRYLKIADCEEEQKQAVIYFHQAYQKQKHLKPYHDLLVIFDYCRDYLLDILEKYKEDKGIHELISFFKILDSFRQREIFFIVDLLNRCFESQSECGWEIYVAYAQECYNVAYPQDYNFRRYFLPTMNGKGLCQRSEEELLERLKKDPGKFPYLFCDHYPALLFKILMEPPHFLEKFCLTLNPNNTAKFWRYCAGEKPELLPALISYSCKRDPKELALLNQAIRCHCKYEKLRLIVEAAPFEFLEAAEGRTEYFFERTDYEKQSSLLIKRLDGKKGNQLILQHRRLPKLKQDLLPFILEKKDIYWVMSHLDISEANVLFLTDHDKVLCENFDEKKIELNDISYRNLNSMLDLVVDGRKINLNYKTIKSISRLLDCHEKLDKSKNHEKILRCLYESQFETLKDKYKAMWEGWLEEKENINVERKNRVDFLSQPVNRIDLKILMTYAIKILEKVDSHLVCDLHSLSKDSQKRLLTWLFQNSWINKISFPEQEVSLLNFVMPTLFMLVKEKMVLKLFQETCDLIIETKDGSLNCHRGFIEPILPLLFEIQSTGGNIKIPLSSRCVKCLLDDIYKYEDEEDNPYYLEKKLTLKEWIKLLTYCSKMSCDWEVMASLTESYVSCWLEKLDIWWTGNYRTVDQLSGYFEVFKNLLMNAAAFEQLNMQRLPAEICRILCTSIQGQFIGISPMVELFEIWAFNENKSKEQQKAHKAWGACWRICFAKYALSLRKNREIATQHLNNILSMSKELSEKLSIPFSIFWSRDILPHLPIEAKAVILAECYKSFINNDSVFDVPTIAEEIWKAYWLSHAEISSYDASELLERINLLLPEGKKIGRHMNSKEGY